MDAGTAVVDTTWWGIFERFWSYTSGEAHLYFEPGRKKVLAYAASRTAFFCPECETLILLGKPRKGTDDPPAAGG
jgi:hypothetical protein